MSYETQWGTIDDRDIEIALSLGLGATQQEVADHLDLSNQAISKRVNHKCPKFYAHVKTLADVFVKSTKSEWHVEMQDRYFALWENALRNVELAITRGDVKLAKETLKDIYDRKIGPVERRVSVKGQLEGRVIHEHALPVDDVKQIASFLQGYKAMLPAPVDADEAVLVDE